MTDSVSYGLKKVRYDSYMDGHARGVSAHCQTLPRLQCETRLRAFRRHPGEFAKEAAGYLEHLKMHALRLHLEYRPVFQAARQQDKP